MIYEMINIIILSSLFEKRHCGLNVNDLQISGKYLKASDYCPKVKGCIEGSHIFCGLNGNNRGRTFSCDNSSGLPLMTNEDAQLMVNLLNEIRSELALGKAVGADGYKIPRAYGMKGVSWDPELATLAQTKTNTCARFAVETGFCIASKKHGKVFVSEYYQLYELPWTIVETSQQFATPEKAWKAFLKSNFDEMYLLRKWFDGTEEKQKLVEHFEGTVQMTQQMYYSETAFMGCGLNNFIQHYYDATEKANTLYLICLFAKELEEGKPIYPNTNEDKSRGDCGCPLGFVEDIKTCLCWRGVNESTEEVNSEEVFCKECVPNILYLPVISFVDRPQTQMPQRQATNTRMRKRIQTRNKQAQALLNRQNGFRVGRRKNQTPSPRPRVNNSNLPQKPAKTSEKQIRTSRINNKPGFLIDGVYDSRTKQMTTIRTKRPSVFAHVPSFKLPVRNKTEKVMIEKHKLNQSNILDYLKNNGQSLIIQNPLVNDFDKNRLKENTSSNISKSAQGYSSLREVFLQNNAKPRAIDDFKTDKRTSKVIKLNETFKSEPENTAIKEKPQNEFLNNMQQLFNELSTLPGVQDSRLKKNNPFMVSRKEDIFKSRNIFGNPTEFRNSRNHGNLKQLSALKRTNSLDKISLP